MSPECPECGDLGTVEGGYLCPVCQGQAPVFVPVLPASAPAPEVGTIPKIPVPDWQCRTWTLPEGAKA